MNFRASLVLVAAIGTAVIGGAPPSGAAAGLVDRGSLPGQLGDLAAVSCPTARHCVAVADATVSDGTQAGVAYTTGGWTSWSKGALPAGLVNLYGVSCPSINRCVAVGGAPGADNGSAGTVGAVVYTTNGGSSWSSSPVPSGSSDLEGVSCPSINRCVAVGVGSDGHGIVYSTSGGARWATGRLPRGAVGDYTGVSCATVDFCVAVGDGTAYTTNGGASWRTGEVPPGGSSLQAVSCPTTRLCAAVGSGEASPWGGPGAGSGMYSTDGGRSWSTSTLPRQLFGVTAVSCRPSRRCLAVGIGVAVSSLNGGASWQRDKLVAAASVLVGLSCPSGRRCMAVGAVAPSSSTGKVVVTTDGGNVWR